ncbi:hypothetical protein ABZS66_19155 [Dactylosporangium sp. NPDC005572]|uniref:hypothetical protein n=1 Tax=Dactylosporangium sp. NPDC005572 TaxID=3156889 RepID=UPI0033BD148A
MSATENAIDEAIAAHAKAEGWTGVTAGWIVLVATVDHDGDNTASGVATIYQGGDMQWPLAIGIVEAARIKMHADYARGEP